MLNRGNPDFKKNMKENGGCHLLLPRPNTRRTSPSDSGSEKPRQWRTWNLVQKQGAAWADPVHQGYANITEAVAAAAEEVPRHDQCTAS
jgi:hypothetical protein